MATMKDLKQLFMVYTCANVNKVVRNNLCLTEFNSQKPMFNIGFSKPGLKFNEVEF